MTTSRLTVLLVILLAGFGAVFLLPTSGKTEPVGIKLALPESIGKWYGIDQPITERERQVLAGDTEFARKVYQDVMGDAVFVSIVLSGHDLDNSIHRADRCRHKGGRLPIPKQLPSRCQRVENSRGRGCTMFARSRRATARRFQFTI